MHHSAPEMFFRNWTFILNPTKDIAVSFFTLTVYMVESLYAGYF